MATSLDVDQLIDDSSVEMQTIVESTGGVSYIYDFLSGERRKETSKERVRQRIVQALVVEYGIAIADIKVDYLLRIEGKRKKVDIAVFKYEESHEVEHLTRVIVCRPEPNTGQKVVRLRDPEQAKKDLEELEELMLAAPGCRWGLWTNGLEFFFLEKKVKNRFETICEPVGDMPRASDTTEGWSTTARITMRPADPEMLRVAFRRCHNFIHGNEGMPKDAAFWQFLYLIFCKIYDEQTHNGDRQFWVGAYEPFDVEGQAAIRQRIETLFEKVKTQYKSIFRGNEDITLSNRALAFIVSELARYNFSDTRVDAKGSAYQEIVGNNLRGDRGQYFTPLGVTRLAIEILNPQPSERALDPACGTAGFLVQTLNHRSEQLYRELKVKRGFETPEQQALIRKQLQEYAAVNLFGADFDPFLIRASQMNMVMAGDGRGHLYHLNSLEFPKGHTADLELAKQDIPLGRDDGGAGMDIVMTNPPFGADIPITDRGILEQYDLAYYWELEDGSYRKTSRLQARISPEVLFVERCVQWLKPGGRMAIVLPNGILGNPGSQYIRWWLLQECWLLASVELPVEVFIVGANVNILTSLLFLRRKTQAEKNAPYLQDYVAEDYPVFMAVAEKVGFDRRGTKLYQRTPEGDDIFFTPTQDEIVAVQRGNEVIERNLGRRPYKKLDDDLPLIAAAYHDFLREEGPRYPHLSDLPVAPLPSER